MSTAFCSHRPGSGRPAPNERMRTPRSLRPPAPVVLLLLLLAAAPGGCRRPPPPPAAPLVVQVEAVRPVSDALRQTGAQPLQTYLGVIRGDAETDLSFKVSGRLETIGTPAGDWPEGQKVRAGTVLARLQQTELAAAFEQAQAQAEFAGRRWTNHHQLFFTADPAISKQEWEKTDADFRSARAEADRARQALEDSELRAPFDGVILARLARTGETVSAGQPVLRLADLRTVSVELGVPDRVVTRMRIGQEIPIRVSALEYTNFTGRVSEVGAATQPGSRLFKVLLKVDNRGELIRSGMTASVALAEEYAFPPGAVLVRLSALVASSPVGSGTTNRSPLAVFVVDAEERAHERPVITDDLIRSSVVVTDGLAAGERVVVVGASLLHDGARVEARPFGAVSGR